MAVQYLLPCECGNTTPVDMSQAGSSVVCDCGKRIEVPSLRAIRELTPLGDDIATGKYEWNQAAGLIFVSGVVLALLSATAAFFMHLNSVQAVNFELPPEEEVAAWIAEVDSAPPEELLTMWNVARHLGLEEYQMSPFVQARQVSRQFAMYRNTSLIVMVCGIALAGTSICLRSKSA